MNGFNPEVDDYFINGCMRCELGGTAACKVHKWEEELDYLRNLVVSTGITEERKWSMPCYTYLKKNVLIIGAFKESCILSFFKGSLLQDEAGILELPGENDAAGRVFRFTNLQQLKDAEEHLRAYIYEAMELEKSGAKVVSKSVEEFEIPEELQAYFDRDVEFKEAFDSLTPGRRKAYIIHFASAKQSKTRIARIEKYYDWILMGRGMMD